ncbi:MAG: PepSY-associated TM helix domain-containing protein [Pleurocapsa sp.]
MDNKKIRNVAFALHRYIGLVVGIILIIVGLTGSLLVFQKEIDHFLIGQQFGRLTPQQQPISLEKIFQNVQETYKNRPDLKLDSISLNTAPDLPSQVWLKSQDDEWIEVLVNPYNNEILGTRQWENTLFGITYQLHYALLAGEPGIIIVGIAALFLFILSVTGLVLWPGWPKRVNFDLHKVAGIISVVFLAMIAFTGFCWNFYEQTEPLIYAVTFSPQPVEPVSQVIPGATTMNLTEIIQRAETALPGGKITYFGIPSEPEGVFHLHKQLPGQKDQSSSEVNLDRYTGKVLKVTDGTQSLSLGETILNAFTPMHYGTFGGIPTRILYVFVGLAPTILFITGLVMYRLRRRPQKVTETSRQLIER